MGGEEVLVKIGFMKKKKRQEGVFDRARNYLLGLSFLRGWSSRPPNKVKQS